MFSKFLTSHFLKYGGILLVLAGIGTIMLDNSPGAEVPLLVGLFSIFIAREKTEDERSFSIRTSSMTLAFVLGYIVELVTSNLYSHAIIDWHLTKITHFIILVLVMAISMFYVRLHFIKE